MNSVDWMKWLIGAGRNTWNGVRTPTPPGYTPPAPVYITVEDSVNGVGGGGQSKYPNLETVLQIATQQLSASIMTQGLSDAQVSALLTASANNAAPWLNGLDPQVKNIQALVQKYVAIYRTAVTPV